jgi:ribosome-associated protein
MIIQICSREQNKKKITDYFDSQSIEWFVSKLPCGDYANPQNMKTIVELKHSHNDGLQELVMNLCRTVNHQRFKNEILLAKKIGVENFIVLIASKDITNVDEIHLWKNKYGKVNPETFEKIVKTFRDKYNIKFEFCKPNECGKKIIELLTN